MFHVSLKLKISSLTVKSPPAARYLDQIRAFLSKTKVSFTVEYKENLRFYQDLVKISAAGGDLPLSEDILSFRDT